MCAGRRWGANLRPTGSARPVFRFCRAVTSGHRAAAARSCLSELLQRLSSGLIRSDGPLYSQGKILQPILLAMFYGKRPIVRSHFSVVLS
jgi:hypothetical protein